LLIPGDVNIPGKEEAWYLVVLAVRDVLGGGGACWPFGEPLLLGMMLSLDFFFLRPTTARSSSCRCRGQAGWPFSEELLDELAWLGFLWLIRHAGCQRDRFSCKSGWLLLQCLRCHLGWQSTPYFRARGSWQKGGRKRGD
jgi:hypothetical protein